MISLEIPLDDGTNYNTTYLREGQVNVTRLDCYTRGDHCITNQPTLHANAHAYGEMTFASDCGSYTDIADVISSKHDYQSYCPVNEPGQGFVHRFNEYNPNDIQKVYPYFTNRIITILSGDCDVYDQVGDPTPDQIGDMNASKFTYANNQSTNGTITIPTAYLGREGTTYIYRGLYAPASASEYACGPRCILMWAYKNPGAKDGPKFYQCPITVSDVSNATQAAHNVSDPVARVAAASIALHGQYEGTEKDKKFMQFQFYAAG